MYETIGFNVRGIAPLLMHNGQLADPLNKWSKALKGVSGKRKKTDADYAELARIEWHGGLYVDEEQRIVIPGENIEAMLISAGKKNRKGEAFKAGLLSDGMWRLSHDGPKDIESLWMDDRFRDTRKVGVNGSSIMRTRPIFRKWSLAFEVQYLPDILNKAEVVEAVQIAGRIIGLCDYTPKFGRFEVN